VSPLPVTGAPHLAGPGVRGRRGWSRGAASGAVAGLDGAADSCA